MLHRKMKRENTYYAIKKYKSMKKSNKKLVQQAKRSYLHTRLYKPLLTGNSKPFFNYLKESRSNASNIIPDLKYDDKLAQTPAEKAMFLGSFFESVFVKDGGQSPEMKSVDIPKDKTDLIISREGVFDLLQNLEESKTGGPDYLSSKVLKLFSRIIAPCLTEIFQYSLDSYTIPSIWKVARVIPIYKKGSKELPTNYRPVSLTCITCKLLEHIVSSKIHDHLNTYTILHDSQHGFRSGRSCDSQLVYTINDLASNLDNRIITDVIILDFSKAFDTVNHRKLLLKLNYYGINENLIFWIGFFIEPKAICFRGRCQLSILSN